jgi:hypothetical protein
MRCVKCSRFTLPQEHLGHSGKLNKLCYKCLGNEMVENIYFIDEFEDIIQVESLFPLCFFLIPADKLEGSLADLGTQLAEIISIEKGYKFR